jgi:hypothetical protein
MEQLPSQPRDVINCVSRSLSNLIRAYVRLPGFESSVGPEVPVTFASPAESDGTDETCLHVYLYQIKPNTYLRNLPNVVVPKAGQGFASLQSTPAPLVVDLLYVMVPFSKSAEYEMMIADGLVRVLDTCGTIPERYLDDGLKSTGNDYLQVVPDFTSVSTIRDLWAGFQQKSYRLTKLYTISAVRLPRNETTDVNVVAQVDMTVARRGAN